MQKDRGQSLLDLLIGMAVFVLVSSAIIFLILDTYSSTRAGEERTRAVLLAKEGLEAVRAIRDNNWADLTLGVHGLALSEDHWILQGESEDISSELREGRREIVIESIGTDRVRVTSRITWRFTELRSPEVSLTTHLTNWLE